MTVVLVGLVVLWFFWRKVRKAKRLRAEYRANYAALQPQHEWSARRSRPYGRLQQKGW